MTTIWHNPRCSKSRQTVALVEEAGISAKLRMYLKDTPSEADLRYVLSKLGIPASHLVRTGETVFKELGLKEASEDQLVAAMVSHPILVERPIVIHGDRAAIGRPPEAVLALF